MKFEHKVSKGSSYNQIYIPREMEQYFEAGDLVEVRLIKKVSKLYYNHLKEADLSDFKRKLIEGIFNNLQNIKGIEQIFVFGSFLTNSVGYNDIDIMILTEKENQEERVYNGLIAEFNLKFHIISVPKNKLDELLNICPLTRSMLYYFVSNKHFEIARDTRVDENHIRFLLMMPEDLLKVGLDDGKVYYDSLRKLVTIENFLKNKEIAPNLIDLGLEKLMRKDKLMFIKEDNVLRGAIRKEIEGIIREKLDLIYKYLKNVKKR